MDGIIFRASALMLKGVCAFERDGKIADIGRLTHLAERYRLGDIVIVSEDDYYDLVAEFAKDVSPRAALLDKGAEHG